MDDRAGEVVRQSATALVEEHGQEAGEERHDREQEADEADERAEERRRVPCRSTTRRRISRIPGVWPRSRQKTTKYEPLTSTPPARRERSDEPAGRTLRPARRSATASRRAPRRPGREEHVESQRHRAGRGAAVGRQAVPVPVVERCGRRSQRRARRSTESSASSARQRMPADQLLAERARLPSQRGSHLGARGDRSTPLELRALEQPIGDRGGQPALDRVRDEPLQPGALERPVDEPASRLVVERGREGLLELRRRDELGSERSATRCSAPSGRRTPSAGRPARVDRALDLGRCEQPAGGVLEPAPARSRASSASGASPRRRGARADHGRPRTTRTGTGPVGRRPRRPACP